MGSAAHTMDSEMALASCYFPPLGRRNQLQTWLSHCLLWDSSLLYTSHASASETETSHGDRSKSPGRIQSFRSSLPERTDFYNSLPPGHSPADPSNLRAVYPRSPIPVSTAVNGDFSPMTSSSSSPHYRPARIMTRDSRLRSLSTASSRTRGEREDSGPARKRQRHGALGSVFSAAGPRQPPSLGERLALIAGILQGN